MDVPTGLVETGDDFATIGPKDIWFIKGVPPIPPTPECYILSPMTCVPDVWNKVLAGAVKVKDWFVVDTDESGNDMSHTDSEQQVMEEL